MHTITNNIDLALDDLELNIISTSLLYRHTPYPLWLQVHLSHKRHNRLVKNNKYLKMKDKDQDLIFESYQKKLIRDGKIAYICEDFEDNNGNPFSDTSDDSDESDKSDDKTDDSESEDTESKDTSSSSAPKSKPKSKPKPKKAKDGKLSEEELDDELDILATKKSKIQKLFDSESIDKDVAHAALDKLKSLTNNLVAQYI